MMLTGNIDTKGAAVLAWAGNYKAAMFQGSAMVGPGFKGWVAEDLFNANLDENAHGKEIKVQGYCTGKEPAYWNHGEVPLIVTVHGILPVVSHAGRVADAELLDVLTRFCRSWCRGNPRCEAAGGGTDPGTNLSATDR